MSVVIDLDGVVWLGERPIAGSVEAIGRLLDAGVAVVLLTNNSMPTRAEYAEKLRRLGIPAERVSLVGSAMVAAELLAPGERALVVGEAGIVDALRAREVIVCGGPTDWSANDPGSDQPVDAVVVGLDRRFSFERLTRAARALHAGARLIGTNDDSTFPVPEGILPGGGSILAAIAVAGATEPVVAGKPHPPVVDLLRRRYHPVELVVGDRRSTDGRLAATLGVPFAHVATGISREPPAGDVPVAREASDLADVVDWWLGARA